MHALLRASTASIGGAYLAYGLQRWRWSAAARLADTAQVTEKVMLVPFTTQPSVTALLLSAALPTDDARTTELFELAVELSAWTWPS